MRKLLTLIFLLNASGCGSQVDDLFCPGLESCVAQKFHFSHLFSDDFNRADQNLDSSVWDVDESAGSSITIDTSAVKTDTNSGSYNPLGFYNTFLHFSHIRVSVTLRIVGANFGATVAGGAAAVVGRAQGISPANAYLCGVVESVGGHSLTMYQAAGAVGPSVSSDVIPLNNGDEYRLQLTFYGGLLVCEIRQTVGGSFSASVYMNDDSYSSGYFGIGGGKSGASDGEAQFDDFLIETAI